VSIINEVEDMIGMKLKDAMDFYGPPPDPEEGVTGLVDWLQKDCAAMATGLHRLQRVCYRMAVVIGKERGEFPSDVLEQFEEREKQEKAE
jgi:hypothetical protein